MSLLFRLPRSIRTRIPNTTHPFPPSSPLLRTVFKRPNPPPPSNPPPPPPFPSPPGTPIINRLQNPIRAKIATSSMRPVLAAGALALAAGGTMVAQTDVLCISRAREGQVWFEKNKDSFALMAAGKRVVLEKGEDGKWRARINPGEGKRSLIDDGYRTDMLGQDSSS